MMRLNRSAVWVSAGALAALAVICGPVATWLQLRGLMPGPGVVPDAVYVLAGERDQNRRVVAACTYLSSVADPASVVSGQAPILAIVGNDTTPGPWSSRDARNLTLGEWAARILAEGIAPDRRQRFRFEVAPGNYRGTDGEMAALAAWFRSMPQVRSVVVVTSPFHMRRSVLRLRRHANGLTVFAFPAEQTWRDRMPWTVLGELAKMARDSMGLGQAPLITRTGWPVGMHTSDVLLIAIVLLLAYAWGAYPPLLALAARVARPRTSPADGVPPRSIAVILAAHNEEHVIGRRIDNLLTSCSLPSSPLPLPSSPLPHCSIHIGLDGCTDRTAQVAREAAKGNPAVHIHEFPARRGKPAVVKNLVELACSTGDPEILVFTDANTSFHADALGKMLAHFADPAVGGVCGRLAFTGSGVSPESAYWNWEAGLKSRESMTDSCLGANGAIYAVRSRLFWRDMPDNTIIDDFVVGMKVREQNYRMVFEPAAVAEEDMPPDRSEWKRRVRIGAGDYQALRLCRRCLRPGYGRFAWMFWSHKVMRWFTPHLLLVLAATVLWHELKPRSPWADEIEWLRVRAVLDRLVEAAAGLALVAAAIGRLARGRAGKLSRLCRLAEHFITMQAALFAGFLRYCRGDLPGYWARTPRPGERGA